MPSIVLSIIHFNVFRLTIIEQLSGSSFAVVVKGVIVAVKYMHSFLPSKVVSFTSKIHYCGVKHIFEYSDSTFDGLHSRE